MNIKLLTVIRLALVNAIGFADSTVVPLWVADVGIRFNVPKWYGGFVGTSQLVAYVLLNLATPILFRGKRPEVLARVSLVVASISCLVALLPTPQFFFIGCIVSGGSLGVVLNSTNRILAGAVEVQEGYAIFQIVEVCFAASLFLVGSILSANLGVQAVFIAVSVVCVIGVLLLNGISSDFINFSRIEPAINLHGSRNAIMVLVALMIFFVGQSSISSYMLPIGRVSGLDTALIGKIVATGLLFALTGAISARIMGNRFGVMLPVGAAAVLLASSFIAITRTDSKLLFSIGALIVPCCTIFAVPYFYTLVAMLDRSGRYASIAPAFLLSGVALGPIVAVQASERSGLPLLGLLAGGSVLIAAALFAVPARNHCVSRSLTSPQQTGSARV